MVLQTPGPVLPTVAISQYFFSEILAGRKDVSIISVSLASKVICGIVGDHQLSTEIINIARAGSVPCTGCEKSEAEVSGHMKDTDTK